MTSSEHNEGLELLKSWSTTPTLIEVGFADIEASSALTAYVKIVEFSPLTLRLESETLTLRLRMSDAQIDRVESRRLLRARGITGKIRESLQVVVFSGDVYVLTGPPELAGN
jgi:hypothetical protein